MSAFTSIGGTVLIDGVPMRESRVDDLLTFYAAREAELEAELASVRQASGELWSARCKASDFRQDATGRRDAA